MYVVAACKHTVRLHSCAACSIITHRCLALRLAGHPGTKARQRAAELDLTLAAVLQPLRRQAHGCSTVSAKLCSHVRRAETCPSTPMPEASYTGLLRHDGVYRAIASTYEDLRSVCTQRSKIRLAEVARASVGMRVLSSKLQRTSATSRCAQAHV